MTVHARVAPDSTAHDSTSYDRTTADRSPDDRIGLIRTTRTTSVLSKTVK